MANPGNDKLDKSSEEKHIHDVPSEEENVNTTPPAPFQGGKNTRGRCAASQTSKKVVYPGDCSRSSTAANPKKPRKKGQVVDFFTGQQKCQICNKHFQNRYALGGHMRWCTMEKKASGSFPPPFTHPSASVAAGDDTNLVDAVPELATALPNCTQQMLSASVFSHIDLNISSPPQDKGGDNGNHMDVYIHYVREKKERFDLNKPPPEEKGDGDDGDNIENN